MERTALVMETHKATPESRTTNETLDNTERLEPTGIPKQEAEEINRSITEKSFNELDETEKKQWAPCDKCFKKYLISSSLAFNFALFLCLNCGLYFCEKCFEQHRKRGWRWFKISKNRSHICVKKDGLEEERKEVIKAMVRELLNEQDRREKIEKIEKVRVFEKISVKHTLDEFDCKITGLCRTGNYRLVVCDCTNSCIKQFRRGSIALKRYIWIRERPYDVTEIRIEQDSTDSESASNSNSVGSTTNFNIPKYKYYLVVTLPRRRRLLFINIYKKPAIVVKRINMEHECTAIESCDDKIYIACNEGPILSVSSHCSVHVMSTDGIPLSVIPAPRVSWLSWPGLAAVTGRVYLTDYFLHTITCLNVGSGNVISQITLEQRSNPKGISVDQDGNVYVCVRWPYHNVYKLNFDLKGPRLPLLDQKSVYMEYPGAMCFDCDKLFVSHYFGPLQNFVSVVKLYTLSPSY